MTHIAESRQTDLSAEQIDARISFHDEAQAMEVDFSNLHLTSQAEVNAFYDRIEDRIAATGEDQWFFAVNYFNSRIDPDAWFAFARRGKTLNMAHSMGSVRFDASEETRRQIENAAGTDAFDPNLLVTRDDAFARLKSLPSQRIHRIEYTPNYTVEDFAPRITFLPDADIMDVNFAGFTFHHSRDVNDFYDHIEDRIKQTDRKWYFLINYNDCQIMPEAWVHYARRGKALNIAASLGSVRYATGSETEEEIRQRAQSQDFRPNIRNTREEAIARIDEMKAEAAHAG